MKPDNLETVPREKPRSFFKRFQEYANQVSGSTNGIKRTSSLTALEDLSNSKVNMRGPRHRRTHKKKQDMLKSNTMSVEELDISGLDSRNNNNIQQDFDEMRLNTEQLTNGGPSEYSDEREFRTPRQRQNNVLNNYLGESTGLSRYNSTGTLDKRSTDHTSFVNGGVIGVKKRHIQQRNRQNNPEVHKMNNDTGEIKELQKKDEDIYKGQRSKQPGVPNATSSRSQSKPRLENVSYIPRSRSLMELRNERIGSFSSMDASHDAHRIQTSNIPRRSMSHSTENLSFSSSSSSAFRRGVSDRRSERGTSYSDSNSSGSTNSRIYKITNRNDSLNISRSTENIASEDLSRWNKMKMYDHNRRQHTPSGTEDIQKRSVSSMRATEEYSDSEKIKSKDRVRSADHSSSGRRGHHGSSRGKHHDKENIPQSRNRTRRALPQLPNANSKEVEERRKRISAIALERVQRGLYALRKEVKEELGNANNTETTGKSDSTHLREGTINGVPDTHKELHIQDQGIPETVNKNYHSKAMAKRKPEKSNDTKALDHPDTNICVEKQKSKTDSELKFKDNPQLLSASMDNLDSRFKHTYEQDNYTLTTKHDSSLSMEVTGLEQNMHAQREQTKDLQDDVVEELEYLKRKTNTGQSKKEDNDTSFHKSVNNDTYVLASSAREVSPIRTITTTACTKDLPHTGFTSLSKSQSHDELGNRDDISTDAIQKLILDLRDAANKPISDTNSASHSSIPSVASRDRVSSPEISQVVSKDSGTDSNSSQGCSNNQSLMQSVKSNTQTAFGGSSTEQTASPETKPQNRPSLHKISQTCDFVSLNLTFDKGDSFTHKYKLAEAPYHEAESAKGGKYIIKPPVGRRHTIQPTGAFAPVSTNATPTSVELTSDSVRSQLCLVAVEVKGQDCLSFKENYIWDGDFLIEVNERFVANMSVQKCMEQINQASTPLDLVVARPKTHPASSSKGDAENGKECEKLKFKFDSMKEEAERNLDVIAELRCAIKEKDNHIQHLEEKYRNHHGHHSALEAELKEKDGKVMEWMLEVNRRDIDLSRLKVQLKQKDDKISQLRKLLIQQTELMQLQGLNGYVNQPDYEMDGEKVSAV